MARDDAPHFCYLPASAADAMACACAAAAAACCALHNALCDGYGKGGDGAEELQAEYAEALVLASLAFKEAGAYVSARTCAARAVEECVRLMGLQVQGGGWVCVGVCVCVLRPCSRSLPHARPSPPSPTGSCTFDQAAAISSMGHTPQPR